MYDDRIKTFPFYIRWGRISFRSTICQYHMRITGLIIQKVCYSIVNAVKRQRWLSTIINFITYVVFKSANSFSIYILIAVDAIEQNLHLFCNTKWNKFLKKVLWHRIANTECESITFDFKSQNYWFIRQGNVDKDISWNSRFML